MSPSAHRPPLVAFIKKMFWLFFLMIVLAIGVDMILGYQQRLARGVALGAGLSFVVQSVFTYLSYYGLSYHRHHIHQGRLIDTRSGSQMLSDMTLALIAKWVVAGVGFVVIFNLPYPMLVSAVFVGFVLMQGLIALLLAKVKQF